MRYFLVVPRDGVNPVNSAKRLGKMGALWMAIES